MTGRSSERLVPYLPRLTLELARAEGAPRAGAIDGSLLFVDISGFTKMSERLARHGRVGAEEVTDAIGTCFEAVLAVAYARGGGLLKFGGDALLLLFRDDGHETRAAEAAIGMQRRLAEVGRLDTSAGRVTLRMSAGLHSGTIHCCIVGSSHRELLLAGHDVSTTVAMEGAATAGQVVASAATAAALPDRMIGPPAGPGVRLRRVAVPDVSPVDVAPPALGDVDVDRFVPAAIRTHLLEQSTSSAQHRRATVAFCHFDGTDEMLEHEGPDAVADALDELVGDVQHAADEQGVTFLGTDIDHDGGKIILVAGAPRALGGDEERMLATLRRIADGERRLPVRIGVHHGPIFAGDVGPPYRRTYTVMGDTVNLAARLMARAEPGQILATPAVLDRSRTRFDVDLLEPFSVKGKRHPVHAVAVGAPRRREQHTAATLPLVGRDAEQRDLADAVAALRAGTGRVVEIVGDAGIGKSRLAEELLRLAAGLPTLRITCDPYEANTPYAPFWWLLHDVLGVGPTAPRAEVERALVELVTARAPALAPWLPLLADVVDVELPPTPETEALEPEYRRDRLDASLATLLGAALPDRVVVLLEDTQYLDEASRTVLRLIVQALAARPALLCATRREPSDSIVDPSAGHVRVLRPRPLTAAEATAAVAEATRADPLLPHETAELVERAGGNPLFLAELLRTSIESDGTVAELPASIDDVITTQIDALPSELRHLLRDAAVLGRTFQLADLDEVLAAERPPPEPATWHELDDFLTFSAPGQLRFHSAVVRDIAYGTLPFRRRRELHARAGDALLAALGDHPETEAELLSMHFFHAQRHRQAWRFACTAGDRARDKYANVDAAQLYQRALSMTRRLPDLEPATVARVWERLGEVHDRAGATDEARAAFRRARRLLAGDLVAEARLLLRESELAERYTSSAQAIRLANRARKLVAEQPGADATRLRAQILAWLATLRQAQGRCRTAITLARDAIAAAQLVGALEAEGQALLALDWAHIELGEGAQATHFDRALEIFEQVGDLDKQALILNNSGGLKYYAGDWDDAVARYEQGRARSERAGNSRNAALGTLNVAEVLMNRGELGEAAAHLTDALQVFRATDDIGSAAQARLYLGRVAFLDGRFDDALEHLDAARAAFGKQYADAAWEVDVQVAECRLLGGAVDEALEIAQDALARSGGADRVLHEAPLERVRGTALLLRGDVAGARTALETSLAAALALDAPYEIALTRRVLVELESRAGDLEAARGHDDECRRLFRALGVRREPPLPVTSE